MGNIVSMQRVLAMQKGSVIEDKENNTTDPLVGSFFMGITSKKEVKMEKSEKKMLREISNDLLTPKKHDFKVENDLYERIDVEIDDDEWSDGADGVPLAEF